MNPDPTQHFSFTDGLTNLPDADPRDRNGSAEPADAMLEDVAEDLLALVERTLLDPHTCAPAATLCLRVLATPGVTVALGYESLAELVRDHLEPTGVLARHGSAWPGCREHSPDAGGTLVRQHPSAVVPGSDPSSPGATDRATAPLCGDAQAPAELLAAGDRSCGQAAERYTEWLRATGIAARVLHQSTLRIDGLQAEDLESILCALDATTPTQCTPSQCHEEQP